MAGVDLRTMAELLGQGALQMVMRYSHLTPEHQAAAVNRLVNSTNRRETTADTGGSEAKVSKMLSIRAQMI